MRPWDWTNWGPPFWDGGKLGPTTSNGRDSCIRGCEPCVIGNERGSWSMLTDASSTIVTVMKSTGAA